MLDTETKRRIDTCRDILVGKVPDPKSQVEQITIALIYKFMDDMDTQAKELGGKRSFFINGFGKYAWSKLLAPTMGGADTLKLYSEAIGKMTENTHLPELFRDIFKNAYLPYRDPETLKSFLKEINYFSYDHSEKLGDAFEYLLSVLGSQGDAGQFRTPRHIIDFIVEVLKPQKHETILDPACGTAGFLISAYKYIRRTNTDAKGKNVLTPTERKKLAQNFKGYDISPDMVRLSLVNLYLHGFTEPHVYEYDTLTQEYRWNEFADVILANPPFMSPKGGIKPHKRFSVQSKRSEVLFVDYMAEHLSPTGRAGIIVPEGIIFQSQGSYVELRKMLVDNSLVAVISLPAGVFNPYSGVKTSILILDKQLAKKASTIAFFKVENDGFGLGAQRRASDKNDLPTVQAELDAYLQGLRSGSPLESSSSGRGQGEGDLLTTGLIVPKEQIAANGDYSLGGGRYLLEELRSAQYPHFPLGEVAIVDWGNTDLTKSSYVDNGQYLCVSAAGCDGRIDHAEHQAGTLVLSAIGANCGRMFFPEGDFTAIKNTMTIKPNSGQLESLYLFHILSKMDFPKRGGGQPFIAKGDVVKLQIPLPPLEVQKEIVAEIEGYQKVINGARAVLDNYRPHIPIHPDWPMVRLGEVCRFIDYRGKTPEKTASGIPLITAKNVREGYINPEPQEFIAEADYDSWMTRGIPQIGDVLFTMEAPLGNVAEITMTGRFALAQRLVALCPDRDQLVGSFLKDILLTSSLQEKILAHQTGTTVYGIKASVLKELTIPVPPLAAQQAIVAEIEAEQALVAANRELITRFEKKIQATLARVWGEDTSNAIDAVVPIGSSTPTIPLLQPVEEKPFFKRAVLAAHIINNSLNDEFFGDTKMEKLMFLAEYHGLKRNLDQRYYKQTAGPYDNKFTRGLFDHIESKAHWFVRRKKGAQFVFSPGKNHEKSKNGYGYFSAEELKRVDWLISKFKDQDYAQPEIVATLYAVWNNRLINCQQTTDECLISDFYEWDSSKKKYEVDKVSKTIMWMRREGLVPNGWGRLIKRAKK